MSQAKHAEIREWIQHEIHSGRFSIGDRLPTERELMDRFDVSRNPVQTAMTKLVETGLIHRRRGSGTVVASTGLRSNLLRLLQTSTDKPEVEGLHRVISTKVIAAKNHPLSVDLFDPKTPVAELTRLKLDENDEGIAFERCVVDLLRAPDILNQDLTTITTGMHYFSIGIETLYASTVISAVHMPDSEAAFLGIDGTTPVIRQQRTIHTSNGVPIERAEFFFHPSKITLEVSQLEH